MTSAKDYASTTRALILGVMNPWPGARIVRDDRDELMHVNWS